MSYRATQRRPGTSAPSDGSRTITLTGAPTQEEGENDSGSGGPNNAPAAGTLKLRGVTRKTRQKVVWSEDVLDNEGCGRKSSKICCIYHKPRAFDESSSEEDSDSDTDSSCGGHNHNRSRQSSNSGGGEGLQNSENGGSVTQVDSDDSDDRRNAYEVAPSSKKDKRTGA